MLEKPGQKQMASDDLQKLSFRERLEKDWTLRIGAVLLSLVLYVIVYLLIYYSTGWTMAIAGIIPAVTVGGVFGFLPGIFAGILTFPVLFISHFMLEGELWSSGFTIGTAISGTGAVILNAGIVGRIRDLDVRFRKSLGERKLADVVLMENVQILSRQKAKLQEINNGLENAHAERKKSVLILQETENRLEKLIGISTDPIVICDSQGRAEKPNRAFCEMVALTEKDMIGKPIHSFSLNSPGKYILETGEEICIDEDHLNNTRKKFKHLFDKGTMFNWEAYLINQNKKIIPTLNNAVCLYD